jgi:hypothetical protein
LGGKKQEGRRRSGRNLLLMPSLRVSFSIPTICANVVCFLKSFFILDMSIIPIVKRVKAAG